MTGGRIPISPRKNHSKKEHCQRLILQNEDYVQVIHLHKKEKKKIKKKTNYYEMKFMQ